MPAHMVKFPKDKHIRKLNGAGYWRHIVVSFHYELWIRKPGQWKDKKMPKKPRLSFDMEKELDQLTAGQLKEFVKLVCTSEPRIKELLRDFVTVKPAQLVLDDYRHKYQSIIINALDDDDRLDWYQAETLHKELLDFISFDVTGLVAQGKYDDVFELTLGLLLELYELGEDYDELDPGVILERCSKIWKRAIGKLNPLQKHKVLESIMKSLVNCHYYNTGDFQAGLKDLLISRFKDKKFHGKLRDFFKAELMAAQQKDGNQVSRHQLQALDYLRLLEAISKDDKEIGDFIARYWHCFTIREHVANQALANKDYDRAALILEANLKEGGLTRRQIDDQVTALKEIYLKTGNVKDLLGLLERIVVEYTPGNLEAYRELKGHFTPSEWEKKSRSIIARLPKLANIARIFREDERYDDLMAYVIKKDGLNDLIKYEAILGPLYPNQVVAKYVQEITRQVANAKSRNQYKDLAKLLGRLGKYDKGKAEASKIIASWQETYSFKPALMEEIAKVKID